MKRSSLFAIAALAALALTAAIGATTASATVLCKTSSSPGCPTSDIYPVGTELSASASHVKITLNNNVWSECSSSTIKVQVTDAGGENKAVKTKDISYSFQGCARAMALTVLGNWEVKHTGSHNGKAIDTGTQLQMDTAGMDCRYKFPYESEIKGGSPAKLLVDGYLVKDSGSPFACPEVLRMTAQYEVKSPAAVYVEERGPRPVALCSANESTCSEANRYGVGTKVNANLKAGTWLKLTNVNNTELLDECASSAMGGQVTNPGSSSTDNALASLSSASFGSCTVPTVAEGVPWTAEFRRTEGGNGTMTVNGFRMNVNTVFFGTCVYGGNPTFALAGGSQAVATANKVEVSKQTGSNFACPAKALLSGTYVLSSPSPLYLTAR